MLEQWISATAWPMTPPSAYGSFHLLFYALVLASAPHLRIVFAGAAPFAAAEFYSV